MGKEYIEKKGETLERLKTYPVNAFGWRELDVLLGDDLEIRHRCKNYFEARSNRGRFRFHFIGKDLEIVD